MVLYERQLMLVAFQIRSLLERPKVALTYAKRRLEVTRYDKVGEKPFTKLDMINIEKHFDCGHPRCELLIVPNICNQLIHHYVMFAMSDQAGCFTTLMLTSDFKRNACLFEISISKLLAFFEMFSAEKSALTQAGKLVPCVWNEEKQDYDFVEVRG